MDCGVHGSNFFRPELRPWSALSANFAYASRVMDSFCAAMRKIGETDAISSFSTPYGEQFVSERATVERRQGGKERQEPLIDPAEIERQPEVNGRAVRGVVGGVDTILGACMYSIGATSPPEACARYAPRSFDDL